MCAFQAPLCQGSISAQDVVRPVPHSLHDERGTARSLSLSRSCDCSLWRSFEETLTRMTRKNKTDVYFKLVFSVSQWAEATRPRMLIYGSLATSSVSFGSSFQVVQQGVFCSRIILDKKYETSSDRFLGRSSLGFCRRNYRRRRCPSFDGRKFWTSHNRQPIHFSWIL